MPIRFPIMVLAAALSPASTDAPPRVPPSRSVTSDAMVDLPDPIRHFFESSNRGDAAAVLECFAADAVIDDWGRRFKGYAGVTAWDRSDNTGVRARFAVSAVRLVEGTYVVSVTVSGGGFNGTGDIRFTLRDDRIARLDIS